MNPVIKLLRGGVAAFVLVALLSAIQPLRALHAADAPAASTEPLAPADPLAPSAFVPVVINEILAHTDPPLVDSVELFNPYGTPADIGGWCLSEKKEKLCRYRFADGVTIAPNGYLVVGATEWNAGSGSDWGLSEMGETLYLSQATPGQAPSGYQHRARFGASANGVSMGRVVTSDGREYFPALRSMTLGGSNDAPDFGPVFIAEVMYQPASAALPEYLEIRNTAAQTVRLYDPLQPGNRWRVDGVGSNYAVPSGLELKPGESLFLTNATPEAFRSAWSLGASVQVATYPGNLKDDGDDVALLRPDTPNLDGTIPYLVVDEIDYTNGYPWPVEAAGQGPGILRANFAGFGQEPGNWRAAQVGLNEAAALALAGFVEAPLAGGGRTVQWKTAWEWRVTHFRVLRAQSANLADAQQVGGNVPALGDRHHGATYALADTTAAQDGVYHYWLAWTSSTGETVAATLEAQIWQPYQMPLIRRN